MFANACIFVTYVCDDSLCLFMLNWKGVSSFMNGEVRLLQHDKGIVEEDDLDRRWEEVTAQVVDEIIFLSKHTAVSNRPAFTLPPIGISPSLETPVWGKCVFWYNFCI